MTNDKVLDILNKDKRAMGVLKEFNQIAKEQNLNDEDYREYRKTVMMMCIANNKEAMKEMAKEVYEKINK